MPIRRLILVCDSHRPRIHGGGCCSDKGASILADSLTKLLVEKGLGEVVEVRTTGCLKNCRQGISVKVMPDNVMYGRVSHTDLAVIVEQHLERNQPVKDLMVAPSPRYISF